MTYAAFHNEVIVLSSMCGARCEAQNSRAHGRASFIGGQSRPSLPRHACSSCYAIAVVRTPSARSLVLILVISLDYLEECGRTSPLAISLHFAPSAHLTLARPQNPIYLYNATNCLDVTRARVDSKVPNQDIEQAELSTVV